MNPWSLGVTPQPPIEAPQAFLQHCGAPRSKEMATGVEGAKSKAFPPERSQTCAWAQGFRGFEVKLGYCPNPVTVHIRGPIEGYIYNHNIIIIQLLLRGQYPRLRHWGGVRG